MRVAGRQTGAPVWSRVGVLVSLIVATAPTLSGCASYTSLALSDGRGANSVAQLTAPTAGMSMPIASSHRFDPSDGLDVTEVAMLAVANSPELRLKRDELGIARAQAFAAGLLPDPQLALSADFPRQSGTGLSTAYSLGLSEDISALLTRSSRRAAARNQVSQVNLDLLWAEWQTVAQARLLFDQVSNLRAQQARLAREQDALATVSGYIHAALQAGNLTYDSASAGLNAAADVHKRLADTAIALHQAQSDLHLLLGLAPTAQLDLVGAPYASRPTPAQVQTALDDLPRRRPDLLALQAGYQSQQARVRSAILAQFPALNIGFNTARDTSAVYTNGLSIGITLPLFDRNRGNIAIERATRQQLHDDYAARVLGTRSDMQRISRDLATLDGQLATLTAHSRQLDQARASAERAWQAGTLDWPTYLAIRSNALGADLDLLATQQQRAMQSIALEALLGNTDLATHSPVSTQASTP
ncbi:transporter [Rhodanobacter sp. B05]|uniref:TolC family protein n=1 Tax=Rhodanobacter sp. B05 TaxID=1945859 RepID=UPI0009C4CE14|nr:TolC family protein [Rhodanobacter sp. B05]OOG55265.1 transporter [Rhodanobacter sp. B05]